MTVMSYISALKAILKLVGVKLNQDSVLLGSLTRACKLCNDQVSIRLPVRRGLLGMLIGAVDILYGSNNWQPYLSIMYKALFSTVYFGLFRVGELMMSLHIVKAVDVHIGTNKDKLMFILHTSKTHNRGVKPQIIKIDGEHNNKIRQNSWNKQAICPFALLKSYVQKRKKFLTENEQFFVFKDCTPVTLYHFRHTLQALLKACHITHPERYCSSSFRSGHTNDMMEAGVSVENDQEIRALEVNYNLYISAYINYHVFHILQGW